MNDTQTSAPVQRTDDSGAASSGQGHGGGGTSSVRGALRGMSYDEGASALAPVQRAESAACDREAMWRAPVQMERKPGAPVQRDAATDPPGDAALADPKTHPEFGKFKAGAVAIGLTEDRALELWTLIIEGIRDRKPGNYEIVADALFQFMQVKPGKMALWSGGIATSNYAVSKGKQTLEAQSFYQCTDGLKLYNDWSRVRPVWAALSKKFVSQCQGEVHCYLRGYSETSIFGEVEHNVLVGKGASVTIIYHALHGPDDDIRELGADGKPLAKGAENPLHSLGDCRAALAAAAPRTA